MKQETNLSIPGMITERIGQQEVLLPININCYNFWKQQIHIGQMSLEETKSKVKNMSPSWKFFIFFKDKWLLPSLLWLTLWLVDLAEWTSYDWLLQQSDHRCLITANCLIILSNYSCTEWWVKNEAANAPITFEEIVMVMIIAWITCSRHSVGKTKCDSKQCYSSREVKKWERLGLSHSINPTQPKPLLLFHFSAPVFALFY